jgi:hypothetical protein
MDCLRRLNLPLVFALMALAQAVGDPALLTTGYYYSLDPLPTPFPKP